MVILIATSALMGMVSLLSLPALPHKIWAVIVLSAVVIGTIALGRMLNFKRPTLSTSIALSLLSFLLGAIYLWFALYAVLSWTLPPSYWKKPLVVEGTIVSSPLLKNRLKSFIYRVDHWPSHPDFPKGVRLQLVWYGSKKNRVSTPLSIGSHWHLKVSLKPVRGLINPGGWDFEKIALTRRIQAVGYVKSGDTLTPSKKSLTGFNDVYYKVARWKDHLKKRCQKLLSKRPFSGVIIALTLGDKERISAKQWDTFKKTGTGHLVAISGLHVGLVATCITKITQKIWRSIPRLVERIPAGVASLNIGLIAATFYAMISGFAPPSQRALIMLALFAYLSQRQINTQPWQALSGALLFVLIWDPLCLLAPGFWLSFGAVSTFLWAIPNPQSVHKTDAFFGFSKILYTQCIIIMGLLPLNLAFFGQISLVSCLANLVAIPWISLMIVPVSLMGVLLSGYAAWVSSYLFKCADKGLQLLDVYLHYLAECSWAVWHHPVYSPLLLGLALLGTCLYLTPSKNRQRYWGVIGLLPALLFTPPSPKGMGTFWLSLLDVGQGLAAVVRTAHHTLIYDTGPSYPFGYDTGSRVLVPYFYYTGITHIDRLIISHGDTDHSGGARSVWRAIPIDSVLSSVPNRFLFMKAQYCRAGQSWDWDHVHFEILHPGPQTHLAGNNASCVLKISSGRHSLLLAGDIEAVAEETLFQRCPKKLASEILLVPHHGSKTSSSTLFLNAVHPKIALVSSGFLNRFHFPHPSIKKHYQQYHIPLLNTADYGAITLKCSPEQKLAIDFESVHRKAIWHVVTVVSR